MQEAAERFSDTSWQIHRQWRQDRIRTPIVLTGETPEKIEHSKHFPFSRNGKLESKISEYAIIEPVKNDKRNKEDVKQTQMTVRSK